MEFSYRSRPSRPLSEDDLRSIAGQSFRNNNRQGITGYLEFTGDGFRQYMVGPAPAVARLSATIIADPRHESIELTYYGPASRKPPKVFMLIGFGRGDGSAAS